MTLCECNCGEEVKKGNKYVRGHNRRGHKHTEETKERISKSARGRELLEKTRKKMSESHLGKKFSKEHKKKISIASKGNKRAEGNQHSKESKKKMSKVKRGNKNPNFKHGKRFLYNKHHRYKKQECFFGCKNTKHYDLHHEPPIQNNILKWEGRLVNICHSCHLKIHSGSLTLPDNIGVVWTKKDTEKEFGGIL
ncbi:MAG: hypothetical protein KAS07_06005 [Candidatus Pacebacteria bacterium]|nr:hypothetical protein [Candidatus Paceibacterota bacterium]